MNRASEAIARRMVEDIENLQLAEILEWALGREVRDAVGISASEWFAGKLRAKAWRR